MQHTIKEFAELGVLLLMFNIGLEVHLSELVKVGKVAVFAGILGVVVPVAFTVLVALPGGHAYDAGSVRWRHPGRHLRQHIGAGSCSSWVICTPRRAMPCSPPRLIDDVLAILAVSP